MKRDNKTKTGTITKIKNYGYYGFIKEDSGTDAFFHGSVVVSPTFNKLREGDKVEYLAVETARGTKAVNVVVTECSK